MSLYRIEGDKMISIRAPLSTKLLRVIYIKTCWIRQANSSIGVTLPDTQNHRLLVEVLYERQKYENNISGRHPQFPKGPPIKKLI